MLRLLRRGFSTLRLGENACLCLSEQTSSKKLVKTGFLTKTPRWFCTISPNPEEELVYKPNFEALTGGDTELAEKLGLIRFELEIANHEGNSVPSNEYLTEKHWKALLDLPNRSQRRRYLNFLFKNENKERNRKIKKEQKKIEREARTQEERPDFTQDYSLGKNQFMLRFYDTSINNFYNYRLMQAMIFSEKLVIDCGYYNDMTLRENQNCAKQLMLLFAENRINNVPYDLHFCNINRESEIMKMLHSYIKTMYDPEFPLNLHEKSYTDIFPKENLVYLTPHCREVLKEYNPNDVYIIGGIVDKVNTEPLSLAKAKMEGIRMAKLPLDYYLHWGSGSGKSLTINHVGSIMLDIKNTGDWNYSLRHVPRRKVQRHETSSKAYSCEVGVPNNDITYTSWKPNKSKVNYKDKDRVPNRLRNLDKLFDDE